MFRRGVSLLVMACCVICTAVGWTAAATSSENDSKAKTLDFSGAQNMWSYGYYGQLGSRGFFGDYNFDRSSTGVFANLNGWVGNPSVQAQPDIQTDLTSGTGASVSNALLNITPRYGNEWVTLKARYTINAYSTSSAPGAVTPMSQAQLTLWSVKVATPLADIAVGKEIFQRGASLQFSENRTSEYLMLTRTYTVPNILGRLVFAGVLPRTVMSWFNPHLWPRYKKSLQKDKGEPDYQLLGGDPETKESIFALRDKEQQEDPIFSEMLKKSSEGMDIANNWPSDEDPYAWNYFAPGSLRIGLGFFAWQVPTPFPTGTALWNRNDLGANALNNVIGAITYTSSDLEFGVGCLRSTYHQGPELAGLSATGTPLNISAPTFERYVTEGWAYLKYSNGQFFFNTELDWFNRVHRFQRSLDGTFFGQPDTTDGSGSRFASKYWESWRYMAEAGAMFGPFVGRLFYCFMPGPDRRHGVLVDRQPFIQELPQQALGLFDPYSTILAFRFGSAVNAPGHISDASVFAVKLDYLLAANLMIEGSFLRAIRNSNGYAVGYVRPNINVANFGTVTYAEPPTSTYRNPAPSVPDRDLGWEAMAGFVWQLAEGFAVTARLAYWQPGKWFNYACIDRSVPNWDIPSSANNWGVRPDRYIDPVLGWEITLIASY